CLMPKKLALQLEEVSEDALKNRIQLRQVKASVDMYDQLLQAVCFFQNNRENSNAERVFSLMPEKNAHSYCTMIRGMVKHRAYSKAFDMYTDLLNNRLSAMMIGAGDLLRQMAQQNIQPNLLTFNSVLKTLRRCGSLARSMALQTLSEMKALNIVYFFSNAMRICLDLKDIQLAYQLHRVLETAGNRKMMGDMLQKTSYYFNNLLFLCYSGRFLNLLCIMEQLDIVLKWYKELVPSMFYPNSKGMLDLLQALDTANHLEMIPQIWKDIKQLGHSRRPAVVEDVLALMARDIQSPEVQVAFADCAAEIKSLYETQERKQTVLEWTAASLGNCTVLFARAGRMPETWNMLEFFKKYNRIPSDLVMNEVLDCIKQNQQPAQALDLVKLASDFSLQSTSKLATRVLEEFQLSEEQRKDLADMTAESTDGSDSD
ncbi:hypothetical protein JD844_002383, partial [Phrynosoma platyrhinos]